MSATVNLSNARQRASLACDVCRSRRTKCDGRKPTCTFCEEHDIACNYRPPVAPGPSRNELEIQAIRERLDDLYSLVSIRRLDPNFIIPGRSTGPTPSVLGHYPVDESIISRNWRIEFPFMTIQTPSIMCLLGQDPKLAARMAAAERTKLTMLTQPDNSVYCNFQYQNALSAFRFFYDKIQHWYPILHTEFLDLYLEKTVGTFTSCPDSCLVLLVAAIGSVCQYSSLSTTYATQPDADYIGKALTMLPNVHFEFSLRSVQCLILLSIYYNCIGKPCQAHDYILMASCKTQALFKCHLYAHSNADMELLRRMFWSILLIETELGYHLDMPESNIWKFDDRILLPGIHDSWEPFQESKRCLIDQSRLSNTSSLTPNDTKAYFLAAISMCRMMRRCFASVMLFNNKEIYAPIIAAELLHQLENWYDHLPTGLRFHRQTSLLITSDVAISHASHQSGSSQAAVKSFLQMQFYQCLISTYWPAVYSVMHLDVANVATLSDCARFFDAYVGLVSNIVTAIQCCLHTPWNFYASLFITTMAAHKGAHAQCLQNTISPKVMLCFKIATEIFENSEAVGISPSLAMIGAILSEQIKTKP